MRLHAPLPAVALAALAALVLGACAPAPQTLQLSWRFADGRACADAGPSVVAASIDGDVAGPSAGFPCPDGEAPAAVALPGAHPGRLQLEARSPQSAVLYRADEDLPDPLPAAWTATLYFTGR